METGIKATKIGKLRIYLRIGEKVKPEKLIHKLFPQNIYRIMMEEARKSGIRNAHIYHTHAAFQNGGKVHHHQIDIENSGLTVCLELVDEKEKLESFFKSHTLLLKNKTVIYQEVELWEHVTESKLP